MPRRSTSLLCPAKDANSWENKRNPLDPNAYIWHQLGKKPCEINAAPGTHAPQQEASCVDGPRLARDLSRAAQKSLAVMCPAC